jgi:hypothetical protein
VASTVFGAGVLLIFWATSNGPTIPAYRQVWLRALHAEVASAEGKDAYGYDTVPLPQFAILPRAGAIYEVFILGPSPANPKQTQVNFGLQNPVGNKIGLTYSVHTALPFDTCSRSLGGNWYWIARLKDGTGCDAGFNLDPGG